MQDDAPSDSPVIGSDWLQPTHSRAGSKPAGGLYLVATPIGNLEDITLRALRILRDADVIACEDSRMTGKLLTLLGLPSKPLLPYHDHNDDRARPRLLEKLRQGAVVALVSDAGMPLISDPGYPLVRDCAAAGIPVTSLPGPSSVLSALQLSGLPSDRFLFAGFLPSKQTARRSALSGLAAVDASLIMLESPNRLADSLADMRDLLGGGRGAAVARELTKLHEEIRRDSLDGLAAHYAEAATPKGEIVVVIGPPLPEAAPAEADLDSRLRDALRHNSPRDAAALVAAALSLPRRMVYARLLDLKQADADGQDGEEDASGSAI